ALAVVRAMAGKEATISGPENVIWAGYDDVAAPAGGAALALQFIADGPNPTGQGPWRWLYLIDAATGALLYQENQVSDVNITGTVQGIATTDFSAWNCPSPETATGL